MLTVKECIETSTVVPSRGPDKQAVRFIINGILGLFEKAGGYVPNLAGALKFNRRWHEDINKTIQKDGNNANRKTNIR